jgi:hypothetical protein
MRVSVVSLSALIGVVGPAVLAASCSSSSKPSGSGPPDSGSSSGGGSSGGEDSSPPPACAQFADDASLTTPVVSFKNDVMPIFEHSCGLSSSCHGDPSDVPQRGIYLGCDINFNPATTSCTQMNPAPDVYKALLTSPEQPLEESCMPFITAGDPTKSYLMHKMDGDESCTLSCCTANNRAVMAAEGAQGTPITGSGWCGTFMPYQVMLLPAGPVCGGTTDCTKPAAFARDTVRAWIEQGAMNN